MIALVADGSLSTALARQAVDGVLETGADVDTVVAERGLKVVSDTGALEQAADEAIAANPDVAEKVRGGKVAGRRRARRRGHEGDPRARPTRLRCGRSCSSGSASARVAWSTGRGTTGPTRRVATGRWRSAQLHGISPSYEALCLGVADDAELLARLDTLPAPKRQPNLLLGAVRFLGGPVDSSPAFRAFVLDGWDDVAATMLRAPHPDQRAAPVRDVAAGAGGAAAAARAARGRRVGRAVPVPGPVRLSLRRAATSHRRRARSCSTARSPAGAAADCVAGRSCGGPGWTSTRSTSHDDEDVRWLEALVWPEQTERFATLRAAVASRGPTAIVHAGDLTTDLAAVAAMAPADATLVVFHSAVLAYLDDAGARALPR